MFWACIELASPENRNKRIDNAEVYRLAQDNNEQDAKVFPVVLLRLCRYRWISGSYRLVDGMHGLQMRGISTNRTVAIRKPTTVKAGQSVRPYSIGDSPLQTVGLWQNQSCHR